MRIVHDNRAATAAEFAMVLPLLLILLFGIIDTGRFMWTVNRAEKATQVGARTAAVTNALSPGLITEDYAGKTIGGTKIEAGGTIPAAALGNLVCNSGGCSCTGTCPSDSSTLDSATFNNVLVARMRQIMPQITAQNVVVTYSGSGFGSAGSIVSGGGGGGGGAPEAMEISPLITVSLIGLEFQPITTLLFASIPLSDFSTTMTAEDASGTISN